MNFKQNRCGKSKNHFLMVSFRLLGITAICFVFTSSVFADHSGKRLFKPLAKKLIVFDLPSQSLKSSLVEFGLQADINIIVPSSLISERQAKSVLGRYSIERALELLLSKTSFSYDIIDASHTVILLLPSVSGGEVSDDQKNVEKDYERPIEDVLVVSARHRDEFLQDVPISLTLFTGDEMGKRGEQDIVQLGASLVNTTLKVARGSNTTLVAFIRGVGQADPVAGFESGVGIYVDDVYFNRPQGGVLDIYDVERIEVLRGPQGTLYGRNTIGGAIKYITQRLSEDPSLGVKASAGSFNQTDLIVTGSAPLLDGLVKVGGSVASFKRDGFGKNIETGQEHYDKEIVAARASLEFTPSDALFVRVTLDNTDDRSHPKPGYRTIPSGPDEDGNVLYPPLRSVYDTRAGATIAGHPINKNRQETFGSAISLEYSMSNELSFKSITAYRTDKQRSIIDFDGLPGNSFDTHVLYENKQLSQELRWMYEGERVQGLVGAYFLKANAFDAFDVVIGSIGDGVGITSFTLGDIDTETWALFFDGSYALTDAVDLSVGARYSSDRRSARIVKEVYSGLVSPYFDGLASDFSSAPTNFKGSRKDTALTPRVSVSWHPDDELLMYASYSQGFKGGGFDPRAPYSSTEERKGFSPEYLDSYEIGIKSSYFGGGILSNLALFYSDYSDVQIPGSFFSDEDGDGVKEMPVYTTTNGGEVSIVGLEYELSARITDSLNFMLAIGLIDAEYRKFMVVSAVLEEEAATVDSDGSAVIVERETGEFEFVDVSDYRDITNTPDTTVSFSLEYNASLWGGRVSLIGSANYTSEESLDHLPVEFLIQPGYTIFDSSAVWRSGNKRWQLGFHAKNISNKKYIVAGYNFPLLGEGSQSAFYGNPRTLTATVKYNF